jgi:hypothetical protein
MIKQAIRAALGLWITVMLPSPASAQTAPSLARVIADGRPWTMAMMPQNRQAKVTLNPDGTGRMEGGPIAMSPTWRGTTDGMCLKPAMLIPERCVTLRREGAAIIGLSDDQVQFRLTR